MCDHSQNTTVKGKLHASCQYGSYPDKYSRSNLRTCTRPHCGCNAFLSNLSFRRQSKYSTALFSDVGLQEDWPSHLCMYLSCLLKMARVIPVHNCRSCVGKVERLEQKLKDLRSRLAQCWQISRYPTCMGMCFLTCYLSTVQKWIGHIRTDFTDRLQAYMDSQVFLGMVTREQVVNTRPLSYNMAGSY